MLLGVDDVVVRWWRDERVMDGSYCDPRTPGENHPRTPCVSRSRHWSYHRRLVADAAYFICGSCADIRLGAYALRWVDQSLITPPCADRSGAALTIIAGSALGWALDPADRGATTFGHTGLPWLGLRAGFLDARTRPRMPRWPWGVMDTTDTDMGIRTPKYEATGYLAFRMAR